MTIAYIIAALLFAVGVGLAVYAGFTDSGTDDWDSLGVMVIGIVVALIGAATAGITALVGWLI